MSSDAFDDPHTRLLLSISLQAAVPLWAQQHSQRSWDFIRERIPICVEVIASHGDNLLYRSKKKGETAEAFNRFAEGLAILSFAPGGVKFLGLHFENAHPESKPVKVRVTVSSDSGAVLHVAKDLDFGEITTICGIRGKYVKSDKDLPLCKLCSRKES